MGGLFPLSVMPECGISSILISWIQHIPRQKFGMMNENCGNIELMQEISGMRMIVEMAQSELTPGARYGKRVKGRCSRGICMSMDLFQRRCMYFHFDQTHRTSLRGQPNYRWWSNEGCRDESHIFRSRPWVYVQACSCTVTEMARANNQSSFARASMVAVHAQAWGVHNWGYDHIDQFK